MRLFFGLPFGEGARRDFAKLQAELKALAIKGRFTDPNNFHLTLFFLGEVGEEALPAAKAALREAPVEPMALTFDQLSSFPGGIWHLDPAFHGPLYAAQLRLARALGRWGFPPEGRPYVPHMTLGRGISLPPGVDPTGPLKVPIQAVTGPGTLFHSHRVEGGLTYTPIFTPDGF